MLIQQPEATPSVYEAGIHSRIRRFVQEHALYRHRSLPLTEDAKYVGAMLNFVEEEFGIRVSACEITEENLGSLRAIARFLASKQPFATG